MYITSQGNISVCLARLKRQPEQQYISVLGKAQETVCLARLKRQPEHHKAIHQCAWQGSRDSQNSNTSVCLARLKRQPEQQYISVLGKAPRDSVLGKAQETVCLARLKRQPEQNRKRRGSRSMNWNNSLKVVIPSLYCNKDVTFNCWKPLE